MRSIIVGLTCFLFCLLLEPAAAALPPLDDAQRHERASEVISGQVEAIYRRRQELKEGYSNQQLLLKIVVEKSHKGELTSGMIILAECWTVDERPEYWVGDGGQRPVPGEGDSGKFFLLEVRPGVYRLLHPNGWERE